MRNYPSENLSTHRAILANVKKFQKTDSIHNLSHFITKANKKVELAKRQITDMIEEFPKLSIRKASRAVRLSFECVRRFLKEYLHLKPYKVHEYHVNQLIMRKGYD